MQILQSDGVVLPEQTLLLQSQVLCDCFGSVSNLKTLRSCYIEFLQAEFLATLSAVATLRVTVKC